MSKNKQNVKSKNEYLIELGKQIREIRESKGLTQEDLVDIDVAHLSEIETGKINVTFLTLVKIAKQLGCDIAAFSKNIPNNISNRSDNNVTEEDEKYLIKLGNQIREVRNSKAWTQTTLANKMGKRRAYISDIERGAQNVSFLTLVKFAETLECDVATFTKNIPD